MGLRLPVGCLVVLGAVNACTTIAEPVPRPAEIAPEERPLPDASDSSSRCRGGGWRSMNGAGFQLSGNVEGTHLLTGSGVSTEADAGPVIFQVAVIGRPDELIGREPVDLASFVNASFATCRYCAFASGECTQVSETAVSCEADYRAVSGTARAVLLPTEAGATYWIELGDVVFARVVRGPGFSTESTDLDDCFAFDRMMFQGAVTPLERPCDPATEIYCAFADTADKR